MLTPTSNPRSDRSPDGKLGYSSPIHDFTLFSGVNEIHFRVGADITLAKGIYYINWSVEETRYDNSADSSVATYHEPTKTMVEVVAKKNNKYQFTTNSPAGLNVPKGTYTTDITVSVSNAPYADVTLDLALSTATADANVVISPNQLVFEKDVTEKSFRIQVTSDYVVTGNTNTKVLEFTATGTDADVFTAPSNVSFTVSEQPADTSAGTISTITTSGNCGQTSCTLDVPVNKVGTLYYAISAKRTDIDSEEFANAFCPDMATIAANAAHPSTPESEMT